MTIELDASALEPPPQDMVQFVFCTSSSTGLLQRARALLDSAPRELSESFEQAMRSSGLN